METIFTYQPTKEELDEIDVNYPDFGLDDYVHDLYKRATQFNSSFEYERLVDLEQLFKIRKDEDKVNHYKQILERDHFEITNKIFNE